MVAPLESRDRTYQIEFKINTFFLAKLEIKLEAQIADRKRGHIEA